ncbi:MAG: hypothetical protein RR308_04620 [Hafnia sp.]
MENKLTGEVDSRETLKIHDVKVKVASWSVVDGVHTPIVYTMQTKDGVFEKHVRYKEGQWSKWHPKKLEPGCSGYYSVGARGHWRLCGPKQQKLLALLFTSAHRCGVIVDSYQDKQNGQ